MRNAAVAQLNRGERSAVAGVARILRIKRPRFGIDFRGELFGVIPRAVSWSAPNEWSSLNVSACSAFGLSGRCFWALEDGIPERCVV